MITLAWYLLKVIICSGILCGYYFLALRNKAFHRWNRFYLLAAIIISLLAPVIKIDIFQNNDNQGTVVQMLQTISYGDEAVIEYSKNSGFQINTQNVAEAAYLFVSVIFLIIFFVSLYKIKRLRRKYPETKIEEISFINTNAKGTPFSFFKSIFWNNAIDLHSKPGQQIFNHEIAHVKEKHSYDKIFMNLILIFFWINPFFWLMRKELYMIHEFIADKEALEDNDINAFAEMILQTVYPGQNFSAQNSFFYSPIKRRIMMLTKNKNPKVSYYSRLLVLPLAAIVFFAFTLKVKSKSHNIYEGKTITVVIDAGHGGDDNGAVSSDGLKEKDVTLSLSQKIADLNSNPHIKILLSRKVNQFISVKDRVLFSKNNDADLFISLHVNGSENKQLNGFSVLIDKENSTKNMLLGSALIDELKKSYQTEEKIGVRKNGVWVLDHNVCPAALIECGYLSNAADEAFITNKANQEKIARNILDGIENYASSLNSNTTVVNESLLADKNDTIPSMYYKGKKVKNVQVQSASKKIKVTAPVIKVTYDDGTTEMISKMEADKRGIVLPSPPPPGLPPHYFNTKNLFIIDGKVSNTGAKNIDPNKIKSISILKQDEAIKKYGDKGKNGVIEITTKSENGNVTVVNTDAKTVHGSSAGMGKDTLPDKVFTKVEVDAQFPGGPQAWQKYIVRKIQESIDSFKNEDYGTCVVRFIVNTDGTVSDVQATTMKGTLLAKLSVDAIKSGPKWVPASQNGHVVAAYRLQPVTLKNTNPETPVNKSTTINTKNDPDKVFIKLEEQASFPGGQRSWLKYISRVFDKNANELMSDKNNLGTCKVRLLVSKDGKVSDVQATTMKGTQLANVAVNAIKKGPEWIPGKQNGKAVNSYIMVPVTFTLSDNVAIKNEPQ